ncbi:MAG: Gfo/Idh/MocA family oxidoreductase [Neomegalonema sp.]|nr:Gfo/Idh/MocA family oxidoreductase [Neomegalonema sp.]
MTATEAGAPRPIAIVGYGKIAADQHKPSIDDSPRFRLAAIVSRNAALADTPSYRSLSEMLSAAPEITAVALCAPPQVRFAMAQEAIQAGRHVFLEKPPGATLSEVETLRQRAAENNVVLFASWHSRYAAGVAPAKSWLAAQQVREARITWREDVRVWHPGQEWIWAAGGFGVFDPGINALSILTEILPAPAHLTRAELEFPENRDAPIAARLAFDGADGAAITADFDFRQEGPQTWDIEVRTDQGVLTLKEGGAKLFIDGVERQDSETLASEYASLYARFAQLLDEGRSDVDLAPLRHVADAFMLGRRIQTDAFYDER